MELEWAVEDLIRDGDLARHLQKARKVYEARMHFLSESLNSRLGDHIAVSSPN